MNAPPTTLAPVNSGTTLALDAAILDLAGQPDTPAHVAEWLRRLASDPRPAGLSAAGEGDRSSSPGSTV
jgi:hypothetical protein